MPTPVVTCLPHICTPPYKHSVAVIQPPEQNQGKNQEIRELPQLVTGMYEHVTANILSLKRVNAFPLRPALTTSIRHHTRQGTG